MNDAGTAWAPGVVYVGGTQVTESPGNSNAPPESNSNCSINVAASSVQGEGSGTVSVTVSVTFLANFVGPQNTYIYGFDGTYYSSIQGVGTWTVNPYYAGAPSVTLTPSTVYGRSGMFTVTATDPNGYNAIPQMFLLINSSLSASSACYIQYDPYWNGLYLFLDNGSPPSTPGTVGAAGTVSNSQCTVDLSRSSVTRSGNSVVLSVFIDFQPSFASSQRTAWTGAVDRANTSSGWLQLGAWNPSLPAAWKGVNYSPRQHSLWRMYYDWDQYGLQSAVASDLALLQASGFNMIHLYVYDQALLEASTGNQELAGFLGPGQSPANSPNNQWQHLDDVVRLAEQNNIGVVINFVSQWPGNNIGPYTTSGDVQTYIVQPYMAWINQFMQYLCSTKGRRNVWAWSDFYALKPSGTIQVWDKYNYLAAYLYQAMDLSSRQHYSPAPGVVGLIAMSVLDFAVDLSSAPTGMLVRDPSAGYPFTVTKAQQEASVMGWLLTSVYGTAKSPDLYSIQVYHPNSFDLFNALYDLTLVPGTGGIPLPPAQILVTEWATSTSLDPHGNGIPSAGDSDDPTMTAAGQVNWVRNTLCALAGTGIQKLAHWNLYDPYTLFSTPPWYGSAAVPNASYLAWFGYWGLGYEQQSAGWKTVWGSVILPYYQNGVLSCPSSLEYAIPVVTLTPWGDYPNYTPGEYYTVGEPVRVSWTASDVAGLSTTAAGGTVGGTYDCETISSVSASGLATVSCGSSDLQPNFTQTGPGTLTITGTSVGGVQQQASVLS
ncbi:hypothetical protein SBA4_2880001 [Candidatus Sulfopaludibacter sp. SbA4]|nr:hypothetical protein SBA4_2880001 [Candidatus Sulfopaludibacter sp. SbA4]